MSPGRWLRRSVSSAGAAPFAGHVSGGRNWDGAGAVVLNVVLNGADKTKELFDQARNSCAILRRNSSAQFFGAIRRALLRRLSPCVQVLIESFEPGELVSKYTLQKALGMEGGDALRKDLAHFVVAR